jgi:hypothetical protein
MKQIWLKLKSKDPLLAAVWQVSHLTPCGRCMSKSQLFMTTLLGKSS